jgi:hypothetical protein
VNPALAAVAAIAIGGGVIAASARDPRATVLGLLVVLLATPLIADPVPSPLAVLARVAAALLAARLMTIALRGEATTTGTPIGWPAEAVIAAAGAVAGYGSHGLGAPALGPAEAQAAAFGLAAVAIAPLVTGRDVLRLGVGAMLLVQAALLVAQALDEPAADGRQLVVAVLTIALGGAIAVIAAAARAGGGLAVLEDAAADSMIRRRGDRRRPTTVATRLGPALGRRRRVAAER